MSWWCLTENATLGFNQLCEQSLFYRHVFTLSQLHLPLSLSPCFSPSFFPSAEQPQREWDVGCMVIESVLIGLQRGLQEANGSRGIRAVPQTASLSSHFLQENILAVLLGFRKGRNVTFWDSISTSWHVLFPVISFDCRPRKGFLQHWLYHLTDWVHHLSGPDCHISPRCRHWRLRSHVSAPGEGGTDVEVFAKEEGVIALSACRLWAHT